MNTPKPQEQRPNPFRQQLHAKLKGQYQSPSITTDRNIMAEEPGVSMARDVVLQQIPEVQPW